MKSIIKKGFAKSFFSDVYQCIPWNVSESSSACQWPFLHLLFSQKRLSYLDYALVRELLRCHPLVEEHVALFLCHLILAAKEGHLCIRIEKEKEKIIPSVNELWGDDEGKVLEQDEAQQLMESILVGSLRVPDDIMTTLKTNDDSIPHTPICKQGNCFYLQKHWISESFFLKFLQKHLKTPPSLFLDPEKIKQSVQKNLSDKLLLEEQARAIVEGCINPLTVITGGPGTGKTYTAGRLIKVFWENLSDEQKKICEVVLAAPTGKAAANLQRSLGRVASSIDGFPSLQTKTLHALLGIKPGFSINQGKRLSADLVLIDESSMIDARLMACLLESLKPGSRLILLGDKHQLPSVEAGSVFFDLIQLQKMHPQLNISCVSLSVCMRAELTTLIDFAQTVKLGLAQEVLDRLNDSSGKGIKRIQISENGKDSQRDFINYVLPFFPCVISAEENPEKFLTLFQTIRVLSPLRKGLFGVEALNQMIWQKLRQSLPMRGCIAIPIMIAVNDYRQELFNGETGVLIRHLPLQSIGTEDYALFPPNHEGGVVRRLSALLLPKYEFAYCLSVHKSQGSEFDHVILVLPEGSELFGREVFYTAITRARKCIEIYGSNHVILKTVNQAGIRLSGIAQRFEM